MADKRIQEGLIKGIFSKEHEKEVKERREYVEEMWKASEAKGKGKK